MLTFKNDETVLVKSQFTSKKKRKKAHTVTSSGVVCRVGHTNTHDSTVVKMDGDEDLVSSFTVVTRFLYSHKNTFIET